MKTIIFFIIIIIFRIKMNQVKRRKTILGNRIQKLKNIELKNEALCEMNFISFYYFVFLHLQQK